MNQPHPFLRFTDQNLMDFAVGLGSGLNLPKTARIREIEAQEGNAFVQYPFGYYESGGNWFNRFANDNDWQVPGPCKLAPVQRIPVLSNFEQMAVNYLKAVISIIGDSDDATAITTNATGILPAGLPYTLNAIDYTADLFEVALINTTGLRDVHLLGEKQSGKWKVQMFIATEPTGITDLYQIYIDAFNANLPLEVDGNGFTYQSVFLDLDFCDFSPEPLQEYFLPAIQGDVFQVNIPTEGSNIPEGAELSALIVDCNGNELPIQSEIVWPEYTVEGCFTGNCEMEFTITIPAEEIPNPTPEPTYGFCEGVPIPDFLICWLPFFPGTISLRIYDEFGNTIATIFSGSPDPLIWPFDSNDALGVLIDWINTKWTGVIASENEAGDLVINFSFSNEDFPDVLCGESYTAGFHCFLEPFGVAPADNKTFGMTEAQTCVCPPETKYGTQYQGQFTIPFTLPDGTYKIALVDNYTGAVYAFSNIIQVDSTDQFSQIIQFQGNNIAEGFEYFNGWFQQVRFGINGAGPDFENQVSVYRDSNGNSRSTSVRTDLILNLHTNWIDDPTLKALQSATNHRTFNVGNQSLYVTDFEVSHNQDFSTITSYFGLCQVKLKAKKQNYQPINQGCVNC